MKKCRINLAYAVSEECCDLGFGNITVSSPRNHRFVQQLHDDVEKYI